MLSTRPRWSPGGRRGGCRRLNRRRGCTIATRASGRAARVSVPTKRRRVGAVDAVHLLRATSRGGELLRVHPRERPPEVLRETGAAFGRTVVQTIGCMGERLCTASEEVGLRWRGIGEEKDEEWKMEGEGEAHLNDVCLGWRVAVGCRRGPGRKSGEGC